MKILSAISILMLSSCFSMEPRLIRQHSDHLNNRLSSDKIRILELASLAPSGHNTQPWKIVINSDDSWILQIREEALLPAVDPLRRESLLSMGAFLQNLVYAAESMGYRTEISFLCRNMTDKHIARIILEKVQGTNDNFIQRITSRRTVKKNFRKEPIDSEDIAFLVSKIKNNNIHARFFPWGSEQCRLINEMEILSNMEQVNRQEVQKELAAWIRWNDKTIYLNRDGINPDSMEIEGLARWFVQIFYNEESVLSESFKKSTMKLIRDLVSSHGGWMILSCSEDNPEQILRTGMAFEKIFLHVRELNIALHPMTQPLEEQKFIPIIKSQLNIEGNPLFILRLGYIDNYPEPKSIRRPIDSFVEFE